MFGSKGANSSGRYPAENPGYETGKNHDYDRTSAKSSRLQSDINSKFQVTIVSITKFSDYGRTFPDYGRNPLSYDRNAPKLRSVLPVTIALVPGTAGTVPVTVGTFPGTVGFVPVTIGTFPFTTGLFSGADRTFDVTVGTPATFTYQYGMY